MPDPRTSKGARIERAAILRRVRLLKSGTKRTLPTGSVVFDVALFNLEQWILGRRKRYERRKGGL